MRITELYIEGFGTLSGVKQSFGSGINTVVAKNGSGKTTLCVFIKAMLFGLGDTRRTSLDENDRKKYLPWSATRAGGMIRIRHKGKNYRIERSFGKTPSEDTLAVYDEDSGRRLELDCEIGEYLFGIDREGFERTVFVSEHRSEGKIENGSISSRLSEVVGYAPDISEYENAEKLLLERRKFYYKKGGGGKIAELRAAKSAVDGEIAELEALLTECEKITQRLTECRSEREELLKNRGAVLKKISENESERARRKEIIRYRELLREAEEKRSDMAKIRAVFGTDMPSRAEIELISDKERAAKSLLSTDNRESESEVGELLAFFKIPTDHDELDRIQEKIRERSEIDAERGRLLRGEDSTSVRMRELFPMGFPTEDEISLLSLGGGESKKHLSAALLFVLIALSGAALGTLVNPLLYALSAVAIPLILFFALKYSAPRRALFRIINRYYPTAARLSQGELVAALEKRIEEYKRLSFMRREREEELGAALDGLNKEIKEFFDRYEPALCGDDEEKIILVRRRLNRLLSLGGISERRRDAERLLAEVGELSEKFGLGEALSLADARRHLDEYERASILLMRVEAELGLFSDDIKRLNNDDISLPFNAEILDTSELDVQISRLDREITLLERTREEHLSRTEALGTLIPRSEALSLELARATDTLETIKKVLSFFEKTYGTMTEKYIGKTRELFKKYSSILKEEGDYSIDTSFVLTKTEGGKTRAEESYSRGTRDLYSLCMRLALCDSLFGDESPFLILDDPFAAFDDERFVLASDMLKKMSEGRQIIYFTCSRSRKI